MFLKSFDYFRGFAIIIIVLGHSFHDTFSVDYPVLAILAEGGTALFVFISGFLFEWLRKDKFIFGNFFKKKILFVLFPYFICSIPAIFLRIFFDVNPDFIDPNINTFYEKIVFYLFTGKQMTAYWYIPFIMTIFLTINLFVFYSKMRFFNQILILIVISSFAVLIHRPLYMIGPIQNYTYFVPYFLLGVLCAQNISFFESKHNLWKISLFSAVLVSIYQVYVVGKSVAYVKDPFLYDGLDWMFVQKILIIFTFMGLSNKIEKMDLNWLSQLAAISFPIFFIHGYALLLLSELGLENLYAFVNNSLLITIINVVIVLFISIVSALIVKKIFRNNSRYIIGA